MGRLAFITDVHLGNHKRLGGPTEASLNERCRDGLAVLENAVALATDKECEALVILGDLFDRADPLPQLVAAVMRILERFPGQTVALVGNHEQVSTAPGDHALAPLDDDESLARVIELPGTFLVNKTTALLAVPFQPGDARDWLPQALTYLAERTDPVAKRRVLALHLGLSDDTTPAFLRGAHDSYDAQALADLCKEHGIGWVFAGNWHERKSWRVAWPSGSKLNHLLRIEQVGALVPTGFDNPGLDAYGGMCILDTSRKDGEVERLTLPGPRFVKVAKDETPPKVPTGCRLYVDEVIDSKVSKAAAKAAAQAARSAVTLEQALAKFVEKMPLDDGVDRQAVLAAAKGYLA